MNMKEIKYPNLNKSTDEGCSQSSWKICMIKHDAQISKLGVPLNSISPQVLWRAVCMELARWQVKQIKTLQMGRTGCTAQNGLGAMWSRCTSPSSGLNSRPSIELLRFIWEAEKETAPCLPPVHLQVLWRGGGTGSRAEWQKSNHLSHCCCLPGSAKQEAGVRSPSQDQKEGASLWSVGA